MDSDVIAAAVRVSRQRDRPVAEIPISAIAKAAGISRSTLMRRIGTRAHLDAAIRGAGVDPGERKPVRERGVEAAARLLAERSLGALTLEAVADAAGCAVPSLHVAFGNRDGLLAAVFDRYGPAPDLQQLATQPPASLQQMVYEIYRALTAAFTQEPLVLSALFADLLARPDGPARRVVQATLPSMVAPLEALLGPHMRAGRLRAMPLPLLVQLLVGPLVSHMLTRPTLQVVMPGALPAIDEVVAIFAEAFLRAAAPAPGPN